MELTTLILYTLVAFGAVISPGPAVLLAITLGTQYGVRKTCFAILGNVAGIAVISLVSAVGLGALLAASSLAFLVMKVIGAIYLVYLGVKFWRSQGSLLVQAANGTIPVKAVKGRQLFSKAFLIAVTNPKPILFFTALFPQFINTQSAVLPQLILLTGIFMSLSFCILVGYALVGSKAQRWLFEPIRMRWFQRISGGLFVAMGLLLATQSRAQPA